LPVEGASSGGKMQVERFFPQKGGAEKSFNNQLTVGRTYWGAPDKKGLGNTDHTNESRLPSHISAGAL